ncbi:MAG: cardiolipin synthase [Erysipelotrichaceae bacterium]
MLKKIIKILSSKLFLVVLAITIQIVFIAGIVLSLSRYFIQVQIVLETLSVVVCIYINNKEDNPAYKISWIFLILLVPVFGAIWYMLFGGTKVPKELQQRDKQSYIQMKDYIDTEEQLLEEIKKENIGAYKQVNYIVSNALFPIYKKTNTTYFKCGEDKLEELLIQLKKAKKFIFLEYFIIAKGEMWNKVLEILKDKVKEGVDVRVIYDDAGCFSTLDQHYDKYLNSIGIKTKVFNPIRARLAIQMNNRDHRKIVVIDGLVGFSGGINLADEYINLINRFGRWKDSAVMIEGQAVWNFTLMFLQFWNYDNTIKDNFLDYRIPKEVFDNYKDDGYVLPFSDSPTDEERVGEYSHINMINGANKYIYIQTPYLVLDYEMKTALLIAAKNGVNVSIMVPHIPDKKYVFALTKGNYKTLVEGGVHIYEYLPGFVHAKSLVSDDIMGIVGTINTDYRSYYLHYEDAVLFYKSKVVMDLKLDFEQSLKECKSISLDDCLNEPLHKRIIRAILNLFAPLL